jgi:hypothetical protein
MLFSACHSSGLRPKRSTTPDGSSHSDGGTGEIGATGTGSAASGGTTEAGGIAGSGGSPNAGGVVTSGGIPGSGGITSSGSPAGSGGITGTGGVTNTGGLISSGGITGTGGVTNTGGLISSGGITGTGGVTNTGGLISSGGGVRSGGTTGFGGITNSAGVINSGGVTSFGGITDSGGIAGSGGITSSGGIASSGGITATGGGPTGHYQMENMNRGVVAVMVAGGVYVGWRMLGYEYDTTASSVAYYLYRDGTKLATVTDSTNYLDASGTASSSYTVSAVVKGLEGPQSPAVTPWPQNYLTVPLAPPSREVFGDTYNANDGSPGDLDGDGQYDIVLKWDPIPCCEDSASLLTSDVLLDGYTLAGKRLWRIDLGPNIRAGWQYTQFSVYDFDGDGKAEVACKTAPGTKDGTGAYLSTGPAAGDDDSVVYRGASGMILTGPEYLTVFDGTTGKELATVDYPVPRGEVGGWGDTVGNRSERYNGGVAFVKEAGVATGRPSIIQQRGYYTRLTVSALTFRNGVLATNWVFDSNVAGNSAAAGGGNHQLMAADADGDGAQEIITGATTIDSAGTFKCSSGMGHGDAMHVGELVVGKGISVFSVHESLGGMDCHDASTCTFYFKVTSPGTDTGRGVAEYVSASDLTAATCSSSVGGNVNCGTGAASSGNAGANFLIYWNADESRELLNGTSITGNGASLTATGCMGNNGTKNTPTLTADLLGDWREEVVWREIGDAALRVYTTTDVTKRRIYTLMHDPTYRAQVAFEQSGYNQPPHVGFHIGAGMADPPKPDIHVK